MRWLSAVLCLLMLCSCTQSNPTVRTSGQSQLSNKLNGWGYGKDKDGNPEFTKDQIAAMEEYDCIYRGDVNEKNLYLTFDCGYEYENLTNDILDVLKQHQVPAAFFITGQYLADNESIVRRMVEEGHIVGNHSETHPSFPSISDKEIERELNGLSEKFNTLFGTSMTYTRPPKGEYSLRTLDTTKRLGYINVFWSFAYKDWEVDKQQGAQHAFESVTKGVKNGAVILLHSVSRDNAQALSDIITHLKQNGYTFLSINNLKELL